MRAMEAMVHFPSKGCRAAGLSQAMPFSLAAQRIKRRIQREIVAGIGSFGRIGRWLGSGRSISLKLNGAKACLKVSTVALGRQSPAYQSLLVTWLVDCVLRLNCERKKEEDGRSLERKE